MKLYSQLSQIGFLKSYSIKFLFIAFLGIHIPLIGIIVFIAFSTDQAFSPAELIGCTLLLTLIATGITLFILHKLIMPIQVANKALRNYLEKKEIPQLPTTFSDEVGVLLKDIQVTVTSVDELLHEKKDLIAMLSHDLRTPTITVLGAVRMLRENPEERTNLSDYLENMEIISEKQLQLMDAVLTLLKQEEHIGGAIEKKQVALAPLVRNVILQAQLLLVNKRLQVKQNIPAQLLVNVEPSSFEQVLNNLLVNAIKFSHSGQAISIEAKEEQPGEVVLQFKDQGIGFAPATSEKLFDRFTQYRQVGTAGEATNGIGLFLCQKIMHQHGGRLSAQSAGIGKGATFTIQLPLN